VTEAKDPGPQGTGLSGTIRVSDLLRDARTRTSLVIALAVLAGLIVWIVAESGGGSKSTSTTPPASPSGKVYETEAALAAAVAPYGQQVYWLGPIPGTKYEVSRSSAGVVVRYLTKSAGANDTKPSLTVATYPLKDAYKITTRPTAGARVVAVPGGGVGVINQLRPNSVYIAFPNVDYQIELYNPNPLAAKLLATGGRLRAVATTSGESTGPAAATTAQLRALSVTLGHPVYWLGHWGGFRYELTKTADGRVFIRYLPRGVQVGSKRDLLTIATYPLKNAFEITSRGASAAGVEKLHVPGGGVGAYSRTNPHSVFLAFPGVDAQIQIYSPSTALPRKLVAHGKVAALGLGS
jgi:hypothetical protein